MVESAQKVKIDESAKLQDKTLRYVENVTHNVTDIEVLYSKYNAQPLFLWYREHMCSNMYRQSKRQNELDCDGPTIKLFFFFFFFIHIIYRAVLSSTPCAGVLTVHCLFNV